MPDYTIGICGLLIIGAILWRYVLAALRISTGIALLAWLVWSAMHANLVMADLKVISGALAGGIAGFIVVGLICGRGIYRMLVRRDELLEIERARQRAKARL